MKLQRSISVLCTFALFATMALAQQAAPAKRALTHQDYDSWRSVVAQQISRDGKFVAYAYMPQDGDGEIVVRNLATGVEWKAPRGYRPPVPPPDDPGTNVAEFMAEQARLLRPVFTADSRFLVFGTEPAKAELNKRKEEPEDMPKNGLSIMDLSNGTVTRIERVKTFRVPEDGSGFIAYQMEAAKPEAPAKPEEKPSASPDPQASPLAEPTPATAAPSTQRPGADRQRRRNTELSLVLRNTATGAERKFSDVLSTSRSAKTPNNSSLQPLAKEDTNGVYFVTTDSDGHQPRCSAAKASINGSPGTKTTRNSPSPATKKTPKLNSRSFASITGTAKIRKRPRSSRSLHPVSAKNSSSANAAVSASRSTAVIFLGTAPPPEPERNPDEEIPADEKVLVDLWHWKDDYVQTIQKVRAEQDRNRSYRAVYDLSRRSSSSLRTSRWRTSRRRTTAVTRSALTIASIDYERLRSGFH